MTLKSKIWLKTISLALAAAFFVQDLLFAAFEVKPAALGLFPKTLPSFEIPRSVALIEDSFRAKGSRTLILFQDAHTNESAQLNISKALDTILAKEKLKYVFLEAGTGDDSLSFLRDKAPLAKREQVARSYIKKGILSGEEHLDLTSDHAFTLWGVENKDLYWKALRAYQAIVKDREAFQLYLKKIEGAIETLKPRIFNPSLRTYDTKREAYLKNEISLTDYYEILADEAKLRGLSLNYFPHLQTLQKVREKEKAIDFGKASAEQAQALAALPPKDFEWLVELTKTTNRTPFKVGSGDQKEEKAFYALLEEKAQDLKAYPELSKYLAYLKEARTIDPQALLKEEKLLEAQLYASLTRNADEARLHEASNALRYLQRLFDLSLTPEEFAEYRRDTKAFDIVRLTGFLNKKIMDLRSHYERTAFLEEGYDAYIRKAEDFYELTYERDREFVKNALAKMDEERERTAVLITGGYHTPNLKSLLKSQNISYISLTPQVFHETNTKRYEKLLLEQLGFESAKRSFEGAADKMKRWPTLQTPYVMDVAAALGARLAVVNRRELLKTAVGAAAAWSGLERLYAGEPEGGSANTVADLVRKYPRVHLTPLESLAQTDPVLADRLAKEIGKGFDVLEKISPMFLGSGVVDAKTDKIVRFDGITVDRLEGTVTITNSNRVGKPYPIKLDEIENAVWKFIVSENAHLSGLDKKDLDLWLQMAGEAGSMKKGVEKWRRRLRSKQFKEYPSESTELMIERTWRAEKQFRDYLDAYLGIKEKSKDDFDPAGIKFMELLLANGTVDEDELFSSLTFWQKGGSVLVWSVVAAVGVGGLGYYFSRKKSVKKDPGTQTPGVSASEPPAKDGARLAEEGNAASRITDQRVARKAIDLASQLLSDGREEPFVREILTASDQFGKLTATQIDYVLAIAGVKIEAQRWVENIRSSNNEEISINRIGDFGDRILRSVGRPGDEHWLLVSVGRRFLEQIFRGTYQNATQKICNAAGTSLSSINEKLETLKMRFPDAASGTLERDHPSGARLAETDLVKRYEGDREYNKYHNYGVKRETTIGDALKDILKLEDRHPSEVMGVNFNSKRSIGKDDPKDLSIPMNEDDLLTVSFSARPTSESRGARLANVRQLLVNHGQAKDLKESAEILESLKAIVPELTGRDLEAGFETLDWNVELFEQILQAVSEASLQSHEVRRVSVDGQLSDQGKVKKGVYAKRFRKVIEYLSENPERPKTPEIAWEVLNAGPRAVRVSLDDSGFAGESPDSEDGTGYISGGEGARLAEGEYPVGLRDKGPVSGFLRSRDIQEEDLRDKEFHLRFPEAGKIVVWLNQENPPSFEALDTLAAARGVDDVSKLSSVEIHPYRKRWSEQSAGARLAAAKAMQTVINQNVSFMEKNLASASSAMILDDWITVLGLVGLDGTIPTFDDGPKRTKNTFTEFDPPSDRPSEGMDQFKGSSKQIEHILQESLKKYEERNQGARLAAERNASERLRQLQEGIDELRKSSREGGQDVTDLLRSMKRWILEIRQLDPAKVEKEAPTAWHLERALALQTAYAYFPKLASRGSISIRTRDQMAAFVGGAKKALESDPAKPAAKIAALLAAFDEAVKSLRPLMRAGYLDRIRSNIANLADVQFVRSEQLQVDRKLSDAYRALRLKPFSGNPAVPRPAAFTLSAPEELHKQGEEADRFLFGLENPGSIKASFVPLTKDPRALTVRMANPFPIGARSGARLAEGVLKKKENVGLVYEASHPPVIAVGDKHFLIARDDESFYIIPGADELVFQDMPGELQAKSLRRVLRFKSHDHPYPSTVELVPGKVVVTKLKGERFQVINRSKQDVHYLGMTPDESVNEPVSEEIVSENLRLLRDPLRNRWALWAVESPRPSDPDSVIKAHMYLAVNEEGRIRSLGDLPRLVNPGEIHIAVYRYMSGRVSYATHVFHAQSKYVPASFAETIKRFNDEAKVDAGSRLAVYGTYFVGPDDSGLKPSAFLQKRGLSEGDFEANVEFQVKLVDEKFFWIRAEAEDFALRVLDEDLAAQGITDTAQIDFIRIEPPAKHYVSEGGRLAAAAKPQEEAGFRGFFVGVAHAFPSHRLNGARLAVDETIFDLVHEKGRFIARSHDGIVVDLDLAALREAVATQSERGEAVVVNTLQMTAAVTRSVAADLAPVAVSHRAPVIVEFNIDLLPEEDRQEYLDHLIAAMKAAKNKPYGKEGVHLRLKGQDRTQIERTRLENPSLFIDNDDDTLPADLKDARKVNITPASLGLRNDRVNIPVGTLRSGDVPAFEAILMLAIYSGRIDPGSVPDGFANAYRTLSGQNVPTDVLLAILKGAADIGTAARYAIVPVTRIDVNRIVQVFNNMVKAIGMAA